MAGVRAALLPSGQLIDNRYRIEEVVGRGGNAAVYRACDEKSGQRVALKRAHSAGGARAAERRRHWLEREYYTLAQLAHPRIIEVYAFGVDDEGAYYTMELLEGGDLADAGPWPCRRACELLIDVASSLAILHSRGFLHRDVSARNVRRGGDQRAKLIDFGALSSIGLALEVVGTPPFVSPEAMQMQVLDARADLFSLGALAYYLLAGRHAYPARKLSELRDHWRSAPRALSRLSPEAPAALCALVAQLLALDRGARPSSAGEVMRRLCAIADLPVQEGVEVSRAYLMTPLLVGREQLQLSTHRSMLRMAHGEGVTIMFEGAPGSGRTRALDTCVLDARLLGANIARADARMGALDEWAVAKLLCRQLFEALPEQAEACGRLLQPWLGPLLAELRGEARGPEAMPERNLLIRGLRDFVLALAERERVVLAVDDVDRIDPASLAFLAALAAHGGGRPLAIALTLDVAARSRGSLSLSLLRARAQRITVEALTAEQSEMLLRSVFGDAKHLPLIAGRVHALAHGNPRAILELAQHLVERGLARYEAGAWLLQAEAGERDLPASMSASLAARLSALGPDARELAEVAAVASRFALTWQQYEQLSPGWTRARLFAALQELIGARVLVEQDDQYSFTQRAFIRVLTDATDPERAGSIESRFADLLAQLPGNVLLRVHHLLAARRDLEAIELLFSHDLRTLKAKAALLETALERAQALDLPERQLCELRLSLLTSSVYALDVNGFQRWAPFALEKLASESGLTQYGLLAHLPEPERLAEALRITHQHYLALPEHQRGFPVDEAVRRLLRLSSGYSVMAIWTFDFTLLDTFPVLSPLAPLSPAISVMQQLVDGSGMWIAGRTVACIEQYQTLLARAEAPDKAGFDGEQGSSIRSLFHQMLGMIKGSLGIAGTEVHAQALERERPFKVTAWRVRQLFHYSQGDLIAARSCQRQGDLLELNEGVEQLAASGTEAVELLTHVRLGDLLAVENALAAIEPLAAKHAGWRIVKAYGQAEQAALKGDHAAALALCERALEQTAPGRHWCYAQLVSLRITLLTALGRAEQACAEGHEHRAQLERERIWPYPPMSVALGAALSAAGRHAEAFDQLEEGLAACSAHGVTGVLLGQLFEQATYAAVAAQDQRRFEVSFAACALEYRKGHNPQLGARLMRLVEVSQAGRMRVMQLMSLLDEVGFVSASADAQLNARFAECMDRADRAHCALSMVLQQAERDSGYLYAVAPDGLVLLGGIPDDRPSPALDEWTRQWHASYVTQPRAAGSEVATETVEATEAGALTQTGTAFSAELSSRFSGADGRSFEAVPLMAADTWEDKLLGVFLLELKGARLVPARPLLMQIAAALHAHGDWFS